MLLVFTDSTCRVSYIIVYKNLKKIQIHAFYVIIHKHNYVNEKMAIDIYILK